MYICLTKINANTGDIPKAGEKIKVTNLPDVKGFNLVWENSSQYPIPAGGLPKYYGTCDDDADININGVLEVLTQEEYDELYRIELDSRIPTTMSARQFRHALNNLDLHNTLLTSIDGLTDPLKTRIELEFEYAITFSRKSAFGRKVQNLLSLTDEEYNNVFLTADLISEMLEDEDLQ